MKAVKITLTRIGNSRGIRIPAATLKRYRLDDGLVLEELADGIMLRPSPAPPAKLSWEATVAEMTTSGEDWQVWDSTVADGLEQMPWRPGPAAVAETRVRYKTKPERPVPKRYAIHWATLDPARGAEMTKTRPVVIVSLDALNARLQTVTVCPLTTSLHPRWRSRLQVPCGETPAEIAVDQIRTIATSRLGDAIGMLADADAMTLRRLITEMYGE